MDKHKILQQKLALVDDVLLGLEADLQGNALPPLVELLDQLEPLVKQMLDGFGEFRGCDMQDSVDLLSAHKAFVKGDPSLNAVRDNVRELVYYRNCLNEQRDDALPPRAERMAVRTTRHIYLYLHSRMEQAAVDD
ncbi:MAG: hypothetical protein OEW58_09720 [Gammaproteobacteria bacterium]|nr:hypothetical protein [Gammaproteobacteria bacterium]